MPGLPDEDPDRIQQCTEQYLDDMQPRDAAELDLVHQMARLSLAVERAERMEIAHMTERVNQATKKRSKSPPPSSVRSSASWAASCSISPPPRT